MKLVYLPSFYRDLKLISQFHSYPTFSFQADGLHILGFAEKDEVAMCCHWKPETFITYQTIETTEKGTEAKYTWDLCKFLDIVPSDCETTVLFQSESLHVSWRHDLFYQWTLPLLDLSMVEFKEKEFDFNVHVSLPRKVFQNLFTIPLLAPALLLTITPTEIKTKCQDFEVCYSNPDHIAQLGSYAESFPCSAVRRLSQYTPETIEKVSIDGGKDLPLLIQYHGLKFFLAS